MVTVCGDYKVTINPVLEVNQYLLPMPEHLFTTLAGGKRFTTLDLSHACNQLQLAASLPHHKHSKMSVASAQHHFR